MPSTIATKFLIISDTHNFEFSDDAGDYQQLQLPTPKADVLLHCGDLTDVGGVASFTKALTMLGRIDAELKLVIAGNHDLQLDQVYWTARGEREGSLTDLEEHHQAVMVMTGPLAAEAGVMFLDEGTHSFTLKSGATFTIYVSPYTPAFCDWAFAYERNEDRFNGPHQVAAGITSIASNPIPDNVDIVMTHGPPKGILDWCPQGHVGCENVLQAIRRVKPMMHCFGHVHDDYGIEVVDWKKATTDKTPLKNEALHRHYDDPPENPYPEPYIWKYGRGDRTLAVNAAIMTAEQQPENAPWLVSLNLSHSV